MIGGGIEFIVVHSKTGGIYERGEKNKQYSVPNGK